MNNKRTEWTFDYTASKLALAATEKRDIHTQKLAWWENKKAETMKNIRETGIEIRDSVASSYSNTKGAFGPQIEISEGMQRDLTECQNKILEHNRMVGEYEGWRQVLEANPEKQLPLSHEDWLFFFSKQ